MGSQQSAVSTDLSEILTARKFRRALALLIEAGVYAEQLGADPWEFAIEIREFRRFGVRENDLRFLVRLQYLSHACEITPLDSEVRQFRPSAPFSERSCFVLTGSGLDAASHDQYGKSVECHNGAPTTHIPLVVRPPLNPPVPSWDAGRRTLSVDGVIVKRFRRQAANQERILTAFQEEGWPTRILDPLSPHPSHDVKRRLSDTIKFLNRGQENELIRFHGDGSGEGVVWRSC